MEGGKIFDTPATAAARRDGAYRVKKIGWKKLWQLRPDLEPANDNKPDDVDTQESTDRRSA